MPDVVLEELLAAFSDDDAEAIDFDDPAIDRMLGLDDSSDDDNTSGDDPDNTATSTEQFGRLGHVRR